MNKRIAFKVMKEVNRVGILNYPNRTRMRKAFRIWLKYDKRKWK